MALISAKSNHEEHPAEVVAGDEPHRFDIFLSYQLFIGEVSIEERGR